MNAPVVAIIGRPNVGKSTFFNRVLGARRAVVHDRPGITRDRNAARADWTGHPFVLIDTGGFLPAAAEGRDAVVRRQAELAIELADVVLFLVDGITGLTDLDQAIAKSLRKRAVPSLVVVNKVDKPGDALVHEFHRLGLGEPIPISSENGFGIGDMLDALVAALPAREARDEEQDGTPRVAIVGRPNVGKSSIVNALLGEERVIVEPEAGTTMDSIDAEWKTPAGRFVLVDTAGIRRQSHYADQAEFFATVRALHALERADVACVVVDATEGFHRQEARLTQNAIDAGRPALLLYNKWDRIEAKEASWKTMTAERARRYPSLADIPALPISATAGTHLHRLPALLMERVKQGDRKFSTSELNKWLASVQRRRQVPSTKLGRTPRLYYVTQTGRRPPELTLFVNAPQHLNDNYRRFLALRFAEDFSLRGAPLRFKFRKSE
ncbi:MAG: ribosome biogenesis GTPase Der [Candidatus Eisenbacteria bacterium]|uniref:GTPase Der n=1 Tax=Eiseniibacteriota bacterium TaxID=2212470 RepID=A0A9D6QLW5_UNCEI|nr:ribosome biogenesis GTPase Der [Candidatus Eisenbacteria bacterium]MBI3539108.1 ribosome biogenesis GTPase Der [Candidatus Eisenbacteria bacterium]